MFSKAECLNMKRQLDEIVLGPIPKFCRNTETKELKYIVNKTIMIGLRIILVTTAVYIYSISHPNAVVKMNITPSYIYYQFKLSVFNFLSSSQRNCDCRSKFGKFSFFNWIQMAMFLTSYINFI